jgi:hypothetical protein
MVRCAWVVGLALAGVSAHGQAVAPAGKPAAMKLVEPPAPLLPANDKLTADTAGVAPALTPEQQTILKEDGLSRSESRAIANAKGAASSGWIEAYEFGDATGASSAYSYLRMGGKPSGTGSAAGSARTLLPSGELVMLSGVSVVRMLVRPPESPTALLTAIEVGLPKAGGRKSLPPLLPTLLPVDVAGIKLEPNSVRYAIGPESYRAMQGVLPPEILGWDKSAEIATASYSVHGTRGTLTLLLYPTPQIAGDRGRAIEKAVNDGQSRGTVKLRRVGPLVGMTSGAFTPEQAEKLVQALHLNEEVSFDKPMPLEFHVEIRKTATLLQSIATFTGLLILASIVVGVFLGGGRAFIRKMRGQSAASDPEFLTIDLRGRPAPLQRSAFVPDRQSPSQPPES